MKHELKRALAAKQTQREKSKQKSVSAKLALLERLRDRHALVRNRGSMSKAARPASK